MNSHLNHLFTPQGLAAAKKQPVSAGEASPIGAGKLKNGDAVPDSISFS